MVQIHLKKSKCDQFGKGVDVVVGRTDQNLCPVSALMTYIDHRTSCPGAFFLNSEHAIVTKSWFIQEFRKLLEKAGFPPQNYAGHSFRIGAATTAAAVGVEDSMIKTLGRCKVQPFSSTFDPLKLS